MIPATLPEAEIGRRLAECDSAAIIKLGRHAEKLRRVLDRLGMLGEAIYVERASQARERVARFAEIAPASVPYFAMALVRHGRG